MSDLGPLQQIVSAIEAMSETADGLKDLLAHLQKHDELLVKHLPQLDDLLPVLDPPRHTLGMVYILCAAAPMLHLRLARSPLSRPRSNCKAAAIPLSNLQAATVFLRQCRRVLLGSDPLQAKMLPAQYVAVCSKFSAAAVAIKAPIAAVQPLLAAARALQPSPAHFTPMHADFLRMCLLAKTYHAAAPVLADDLLQVDKEATGVTPRDLLLYHYYAGMVHVGGKRFKAAIEAFTLCFSAPSTVLNAIMVEAYKKCLLCSLIEAGGPPRVPKYTASPVQRHLKGGAKEYSEFAEAFGTLKLDKLRAKLEQHSAAFAKDHNLGLAKQCAEALVRRNIHRLTQTYLTLSLEHIKEATSLGSAADAERIIANMISCGEISAAIDEGAGMVHFIERPEQFDSTASVAHMEASLSKVVGLAQRLHEMHATLATDPQYLSRVASQERQPKWDDGGDMK